MSAGNNTLPLAKQSQAQYHLYLSRFLTSIRTWDGRRGREEFVKPLKGFKQPNKLD